MTPYAELLVRPSDSDEVIRRWFHVLSRLEHPDRDGAQGHPGPHWYALTAAYGAIRTLGMRTAWAASQARLSGLCVVCGGFGVTGSRVGKALPKVCVACNGEGRKVR